MGTFNQCPQKFKFNKIDLLPDSPTKESLLGNFVHEVLEEFYVLPAGERNLGAIKALASSVWHASSWEERVLPIVKDAESLRLFRWNAWYCLENLWKVEEPSSITPAGIEFELNGQIDGVNIKGFIDRYSLSGQNEWTISDYKTGKTPKPSYVGDKFLQLQIYATLVTNMSLGSVAATELLYLKDGVQFHEPFNDEAMENVVNYVRTTKNAVDKACERNDFPTNKTILCNWCSYKPICPAWAKRGQF